MEDVEAGEPEEFIEDLGDIDDDFDEELDNSDETESLKQSHRKKQGMSQISEMISKKKEQIMKEEQPSSIFDHYMFNDDGYDYSKHLLPSGGGYFIPSEKPVIAEEEIVHSETEEIAGICVSLLFLLSFSFASDSCSLNLWRISSCRCQSRFGR